MSSFKSAVATAFDPISSGPFKGAWAWGRGEAESAPAHKSKTIRDIEMKFDGVV